jgi:hypothetical protein
MCAALWCLPNCCDRLQRVSIRLCLWLLFFLLQVCVQLKMCPPPSLFGASFSMQAAMLRSKFNKFSSSKFIRAN